MTITNLNLAFKKKYDDRDKEYEIVNVALSKGQREIRIRDFVINSIQDHKASIPAIFRKSLISDSEEQFRYRLNIQFKRPPLDPRVRSYELEDIKNLTVLNVIRSPYFLKENHTIFISLMKKYSNATHPFLRPIPRIKKQK